MKPWWRREIDSARAGADRAEQVQRDAETFGVVADKVKERAKVVEKQLRNELITNGFVEALREAFGSPGTVR